ncbi:unnamed protein product [Mycena citricolor]|uniref:S-adenosylmethionine-dependent methyltransferase n=1 Tax=Mycena citricolor TaxID=2018698 RepID=A0AAD2HK68_9AGAR|nr:unnamed protein product [Mycena citricolor]
MLISSATIDPPSQKLPPPRSLGSLPPEVLHEYVEYLRTLYMPSVRGSKILRRTLEVSDGRTGVEIQRAEGNGRKNVSGNDDRDEVEDEGDPYTALRTDAFERTHALRWLSYLTTRFPDTPAAASLLANLAGPGGSGPMTRVLPLYRHASAGGWKRMALTVTVRDMPLSDGLESAGVQTWGGACVLADLMSRDPAIFRLGGRSESGNDAEPLRVLELGSGTGLVGIAYTKLAEAESAGRPKTRVVCTDLYPAVLENLAWNVTQNFSPSTFELGCATSTSICVHPLDWAAFTSPTTPSSPQSAPSLCPLTTHLSPGFDVILGADIAYEPPHAAWIYAAVRAMLRRSPDALFHLVMPLRPTHAVECEDVERTFGMRTSRTGDGEQLVVRRKERVVCAVGDGGQQQVVYAYYQIGWGFRAGVSHDS